MSVNRVKEYLKQHAPDVVVVEHEQSTATVVEAAQAFQVEPGQIAKTLSLKIQEEVLLLVMAGNAKLHNKKFKDVFGKKPKMLKFDEVEPLTGFKPGGVCPFAVPDSVKIYCDMSLRAHNEVLPAAGSTNSGVRIEPERLAGICHADWVDVSDLA